jgi:hypothetical protein
MRRNHEWTDCFRPIMSGELSLQLLHSLSQPTLRNPGALAESERLVRRNL